jgi:hypothetical protein
MYETMSKTALSLSLSLSLSQSLDYLLAMTGLAAGERLGIPLDGLGMPPPPPPPRGCTRKTTRISGVVLIRIQLVPCIRIYKATQKSKKKEMQCFEELEMSSFEGWSLEVLYCGLRRIPYGIMEYQK